MVKNSNKKVINRSILNYKLPSVKALLFRFTLNEHRNIETFNSMVCKIILNTLKIMDESNIQEIENPIFQNIWKDYQESNIQKQALTVSHTEKLFKKQTEIKFLVFFKQKTQINLKMINEFNEGKNEWIMSKDIEKVQASNKILNWLFEPKDKDLLNFYFVSPGMVTKKENNKKETD